MELVPYASETTAVHPNVLYLLGCGGKYEGAASQRTFLRALLLQSAPPARDRSRERRGDRLRLRERSCEQRCSREGLLGLRCARERSLERECAREWIPRVGEIRHSSSTCGYAPERALLSWSAPKSVLLGIPAPENDAGASSPQRTFSQALSLQRTTWGPRRSRVRSPARDRSRERRGRTQLLQRTFLGTPPHTARGATADIPPRRPKALFRT